jgi:hypothetical protein
MKVTHRVFLLGFPGLWIQNRTHILYSQEAHITFWCPMRFELYPLDKQVGSQLEGLLIFSVVTQI